MRHIGQTKGSLKVEDRSILSQSLRHFRLEQGWSQAEMAKACGISPFMLATMECQAPTVEPKMNQAYIAKFLEVGLDLVSKVEGLKVVHGHCKGLTTPDYNVKVKGDKLSQDLQKAYSIMEKSRDAYLAQIESKGKAKRKIEERAEKLVQEAHEIEEEMRDIRKKVHKCELSMDNIKLSMVGEPKEAQSENPA